MDETRVHSNREKKGVFIWEEKRPNQSNLEKGGEKVFTTEGRGRKGKSLERMILSSSARKKEERLSGKLSPLS